MQNTKISKQTYHRQTRPGDFPFPSCTHHTVPGCCRRSALWPDWPPGSTMGWGRRKSGCPGGGWTRCTQWSRISRLPPDTADGWSLCSVWPRGRGCHGFRLVRGIQGSSTKTCTCTVVEEGLISSVATSPWYFNMRPLAQEPWRPGTHWKLSTAMVRLWLGDRSSTRT